MDLQQTVSKLFTKLGVWAEDLVLLLPNFFAAVVVVVAFWLAAKLMRKAMRKGLDPILPAQIVRLLASAAYLSIILAGLFVALGIVGLEKTVTSLLAGAGIVGLALGFAFQDIAANFMSGILLALRRPFAVGDMIETNDYLGVVEAISLRSTEVLLPEGQIVLVPNRQVFENPIVNYSRIGQRCVDLPAGVAYGDDLDRAREVAVAAVETVEPRSDRPVELFFTEFGDSSINFVVRFWIDFERQSEYLAARSDAIRKIKVAFDEAGLTIPFPIRTLDFGVVGGEKLSENLAVLPGFGASARRS